MLSRKLVHRLAKMGFPELFEKKNSIHCIPGICLMEWVSWPLLIFVYPQFCPSGGQIFPRKLRSGIFSWNLFAKFISYLAFTLFGWVFWHFRVPTLNTITLVAKYLPKNGISRFFRKQYLLISYHTWHVPLCGVSLDHYSITLGPHEAGVGAKHPSLTLPCPSRGEPSRHLGSSYQQGVSLLSPLIADLSGLWGSSMQVMHGRPQGSFSRWQGG